MAATVRQLTPDAPDRRGKQRIPQPAGVGVEQASNRDFFSVAAQQLPSEVERSNGSGYFAAVYIAIDVESGFLPIGSGCCLGNRQRPNVASLVALAYRL